jgi:hypothetical protein
MPGGWLIGGLYPSVPTPWAAALRRPSCWGGRGREGFRFAWPDPFGLAGR